MRIDFYIRRSIFIVFFTIFTFYYGVFSAFAFSDYDSLFTVRGLRVDKTDATAAIAREKGILEAEQRAYEIVLNRLTLSRDNSKLPSILPEELVNLVQDLSISGEKTSSVRYMADVIVRFKPEAIKKLLQDNSLSFVNSVSKPFAILPIYKEGIRTILWEDDNPWFKYWREQDIDNPIVPLILPYGDAIDSESTSALFSGSSSFNVQSLKERYKVSGVFLLEMEHNKDFLNITVTPIGDNKEGSFRSFSMTVSLNAGLRRGMSAAGEAIINQLNNEWKENNAVSFSEASFIVVIVPITTLKDWLDVKSILDKASFIKHYDLQAIRKDKVQLTIYFSRSLSQLTGELSSGGLTLEQTGKGLWLLYKDKKGEEKIFKEEEGFSGLKVSPEVSIETEEISIWGLSD